MQQRSDIVLTTPALVPTAGSFDRKPRSLERDVTTIGRAHGTDLCLEANEISTLHCVIYRTTHGYHIRDCNSQCGTRVNGESTKYSRLRNGDIVNVGPISFEFRLPAAFFPQNNTKIDPVQVEHWKNSRRKLAQLALKLRKRLIHGAASLSEQEWTQKVHLLKQQRRGIFTTPALVPIAGDFDRKPRSLERDVTIIGRARGSDLCLEANEISTLHCIIYRTTDGYRIRDCKSRCGTRVNGESAKNRRLHNGDIVNLGPISFEFRLPAALFPQNNTKIDPVQVEHWKNSRRKFARMALKMRKRLVHGAASLREQEWTQKARHLLEEKIRTYEQRLRELEEAERKLTAEREQLAREKEQWGKAQTKSSGVLEDRQALLAEQQKWTQKAHLLEEKIRSYEKRLPELEGAEQELTAEREQLAREKEQWGKAQTKSSGVLENQRTLLAGQEAAVRVQKAELARMMGDLRKMQEDLRKQAKPDVRALQEDLERARRENAELRAAFEEIAQAQASDDASAGHGEFLSQVEDLREQVKFLRAELDTKETVLRDVQQHPHGAGAGEEAANLRAENTLLKTLLDEKSRSLDALVKQKAQAPKTKSDLEHYETELIESRRQLESDRGELNKEVEMLRGRNKELDDAIGEMEMDMSRERAELARERTRQERVREEMKTDMERLQRELAVRDSTAPVQKLRDEPNGKQPPAGKGGQPLSDRLRNMRNLLSDSPTTSS